MNEFTLDGIKLNLMITYRNDKLVLVHNLDAPNYHLIVTPTDATVGTKLGTLEDLLDMPHGTNYNILMPNDWIFNIMLIES